MILIDNRDLLRKKYREVLNKLKCIEVNLEYKNAVFVEKTKTDFPTLKIQKDEKKLYLHSKYDPHMEAQRLVEKLQNIDNYDHVFFYGVGLGYHIRAFLTQYPQMKFSIYEPSLNVLYHYLSRQNLKELPTDNMLTLLIGTEEVKIKAEIERLLKVQGPKILIVALPSYERIYKEQFTFCKDTIKALLSDKKNNLGINQTFQQLWTVNAIRNFPKLLETPNILLNIDKSAFKDKPVLLVAAGPSLSEELEHIHYIKEHGLAYIFSVGSAINALIEYDIYPDAACTYDPSFTNQFVIQKLKDKNITEIPLIFGSSVGFETIEDYPGKMLHMITSQDTVAPYYLNESKLKGVFDAPSIAVVTYQLLYLLGCSRIILVGQNLGYRDKSRYAKGIEYEHISSTLSDEELAKTLYVDDVYGNKILTNDLFNRMRSQLESYIAEVPQIQTINTTKDGAHIKGTTFMTLKQVIKDFLKERVVSNSWYSVENDYNLIAVEKQHYAMNQKQKEFENVLSKLFNRMRDIERIASLANRNQMEKIFVQFDKEFNQMKRNTFYQVFLEPMLRVQNESLIEKSKKIRFEQNIKLKANGILDIFERYLVACQTQYQFVLPFYEELNERLSKKYRQ